MTSSTSQQTINYLNAAFHGESDAANRYKEFAIKADAEGYTYAARLFRAAARAEMVHLEGHKKAILALGGTVKEHIPRDIKIGPTAENLAVSVAGEVHERDVMYPKFLAAAEAEGATEAIRSMTNALKAETEHAALFLDAIYNLGKHADQPVLVCPCCGYTATTLPGENCVVCLSFTNGFERFE